MTIRTVTFEEQLEVKTPGSKRIYERAKQLLPGGTARNATFMQPYPVYAREARGAFLVDVDGNEYLDLCLDGGSCIFGHCSDVVTTPVKRQLDQMHLVSMATELEVALAEKINRHMPFVEMVRFLNSGSEACMMAARVARTYTGKPKIAMFEGHHHGQLDSLLVSHYSAPAGPPDQPLTVLDSQGLPPWVRESIVVLPFNNAEAAEALLRKHAGELAAVMMEPITIFGGAIPSEPAFISTIRELTRELGLLLIFDEVPLGFRIGMDGAAGYYGVEPDLYITGKAISGGIPIGVYGGRRDIMDRVVTPPFDPTTKALSSGTYSGNPVALRAALAVIEHLEQSDAHQYLEKLGNLARDGLRSLCSELHVPVQVTGIKSLFGIHFSEQPVRNSRDAGRADPRRREFALGLMVNGVFLPSGRISAFLSTAHTVEHIDRFLAACRKVLKEMFA